MSTPDPLATSSAPPVAPEAVEATVERRRTSLLVDAERPVPDDLVDRLVAAATWAPNHKRTWPWRFTVVSGEARGRLGSAMAELGEAEGLPEPKVAKLRTKYRRSPTLLLVWQALDEEPVRRREDRDAVAAAVQNALLVATAHGLSSYWGTVPDVLVPAVRGVAGVDERHDLVALVYLGWPTASVPAPVRPAPEVTRLS
ncbi:nitroreductase [Aquihabitans sp. G128]|uniref:nitroreductase family protein n=1 Tax=Aquihabitans sp. G128 TaxID=2849779 RepID=UPI001C24A45B|nr:nitroreductase [Aquihabitans sp. G128]QXC63135.1 nitroreductase [Aquihabitans sp. G128]